MSFKTCLTAQSHLSEYLILEGLDCHNCMPVGFEAIGDSDLRGIIRPAPKAVVVSP